MPRRRRTPFILAVICFPWHMIAVFIEAPNLPSWMIQAEREAYAAKIASKGRRK